MAYTQFSPIVPAITQTRQQIVDSSRANLVALRDAVIVGRLPGWTLTVAGGTAEEPLTRVWANGTERLAAAFIWSGGYATTIQWTYSSNSGVNYDTICVETLSYDGLGNMNGGTNNSILSWLFEWIGKLKSLRTTTTAHTGSTGTAVHGLGTMSTQNASAVAISGGTINGAPIGGTVQQLANFLAAREKHVSVAFVAGGTTLDWSTGASFDVTATGTGAATFVFTNGPASGLAQSIVLLLTNGGLRTWTWPATVRWASGVAPVLTSSGVDVLQFFTRDAGANIHGFLASKDSR